MCKEIDQVKLAKDIATSAHNGQIRKRGEDKGKPYIVHPQRIAGMFDDPYLKASAWPHDVLEDTIETVPTLRGSGVSELVIDIVVTLTKKENENYLDFIMRIKDNKWATLVKIADIEDNMISLEEGSLKDKYRLARYILKEKE